MNMKQMIIPAMLSKSVIISAIGFLSSRSTMGESSLGSLTFRFVPHGINSYIQINMSIVLISARSTMAVENTTKRSHRDRYIHQLSSPELLGLRITALILKVS